MRRKGRLRKIWCPEYLEPRRVNATLSGAVWVDHNGSSSIDTGDEPVASALVWIDSNRNGIRGGDEPTTRTSATGAYLFEGLTAGDYEVRMEPPPGLFQTSPSEFFALYRGGAPDRYGVAEIDIRSGSVTPRTPADPIGLRHGLIKTVQGIYYGAGQSTDSLFRIDPVTGVQTKIGYTGKEIVAGLAYDPIMDKIYTLGRDTEVGFPELNLYEVDRTTAALTRVGTGEGVSNVRGATGLTFDTVRREVVLFDDGLNQIIAYDLDGQGRKALQLPPNASFRNLAFDGTRLLTFATDEQGVTGLYEIDRVQQALELIQTLPNTLSHEAGDILGVNQAFKLHIDDNSSQVQGGDFLTRQMELPTSTLHVSSSELRLTTSDGMNDEFSLEGATSPVRFCVASVASRLTIVQDELSSNVVTVSTSAFDDRVELDALPKFGLHMGAGEDTLAFSGPLEFELKSLTGLVSGVDVVDLTAAGAARLTVDSAALGSLNETQSLIVVIASDDQLVLNEQAWKAEQPQVGSISGVPSRRHQLVIDEVLLELIDGHGWRNPLLSEDVNRDGIVSPIDALLIINELNSGRSRSLSAAAASDAALDYIDTSGDNQLSPLDALLVIQRLNT